MAVAAPPTADRCTSAAPFPFFLFSFSPPFVTSVLSVLSFFPHFVEYEPVLQTVQSLPQGGFRGGDTRPWAKGGISTKKIKRLLP